MKKTLTVCAVSVCLLAAIALCLFAYPWLIMNCYTSKQPEPQQPKITEAEFPYTIIYKVNGEERSISDTIICKYNGIVSDEGHMSKYRDWIMSYASGDLPNILYKISDTQFICYSFQFSAAYLMGDRDAPSFKHYDDVIFVVDVTGDHNESNRIDELTLMELYGIEIVEVKGLSPISNSF